MLAGITGGSGAGNLVLYDFALQYQTLIGRLFGSDLMFTWQPQSHKLTLHRRPAMQENILLWVYNYRPDNVLLADTYARQWLRDYAIAAAKMMLGEARSLYGNFIGPQGGTSLNGDALKQEAIADMQRLEDEIYKQMDGGGQGVGGYGFLIG